MIKIKDFTLALKNLEGVTYPTHLPPMLVWDIRASTKVICKETGIGEKISTYR